MEWRLDGSDWEAGYFISEKEYDAWTRRSRTLERQLLDSARSAGFTRCGGARGDLLSATVPGCDRTVLWDHGLIADPFFGRNLETSSWSERQSWAFRKKFRVPEPMRGARQLRLRFLGIDYQARFFLNDIHLGDHTGMFMPVEFEVTPYLDPDGENLLAVIFEPAPAGRPDHCDREPADFADFHRVQCGFGWDWSRRLVPTGIWDSVILSASERARIRDFHWLTRGDEVALELEIEALEDCAMPVAVTLTPDNFTGDSYTHRARLELAHGSNRRMLEFAAPGARKWFPANYGEPALYRLELNFDGRTETRTVGFRELAMRRNPGSPEGAYDLTFEINDLPIFVRGANWVPVDLLPSRATAADYEELVALAATAHFNCFRIWGGGLVEKEAFYECCDRHGILVWQEFPHACSNYRKDAEYLAVKAREGEAIVRKLRNHVSTALFCGGNEVQYYGEIPDSPLYRQYRELVDRLAPGIAFHTSSPDASRPGERPHGPWNYREHEFYNRHFRQLASEIGCNAIPEVESLARFIPSGEPIPDGQSWRYHFLNLHGAHDLRLPLENFELGALRDWAQASMFAQADAAGYIFEHYRRQFPRASGCLFWQYNEPWPTCSWSLVDYYRVPKAALYRLGAANAPRSFSLEDRSWRLEDGVWRGTLWFCGDLEGVAGKVTLSFCDGAGRDLGSEVLELELPPGVSRIAAFERDCRRAEFGLVLVVIRAVDRAGTTVFRGDRIYGAPDFKTAFRLDSPRLEYRVRQTGRTLEVTVTNAGSVPAFAVRARTARRAVWRDNYQSLAPGETTVYRAELADDAPLGAAEIELTNWN